MDEFVELCEYCRLKFRQLCVRNTECAARVLRWLVPPASFGSYTYCSLDVIGTWAGEEWHHSTYRVIIRLLSHHHSRYAFLTADAPQSRGSLACDISSFLSSQSERWNGAKKGNYPRQQVYLPLDMCRCLILSRLSGEERSMERIEYTQTDPSFQALGCALVCTIVHDTPYGGGRLCALVIKRFHFFFYHFLFLVPSKLFRDILCVCLWVEYQLNGCCHRR